MEENSMLVFSNEKNKFIWWNILSCGPHIKSVVKKLLRFEICGIIGFRQENRVG